MLNFGTLQKLPKDLISDIESIFFEEGEPCEEQNLIFLEKNY